MYWIYIANNWEKCVSLEDVCAPFGRGFGECAFSRIYICIGYTLPTFGENVSVWSVSVRPPGAGLENVHFLEYIFVLDIHCQQLGKMCQLEGVCAPFGAGLENVHFLEYTFVLDMHCQLLGKMCQLEGVTVRQGCIK